MVCFILGKIKELWKKLSLMYPAYSIYHIWGQIQPEAITVMPCLKTSEGTYLYWSPGAQLLDPGRQFSCSYVFPLLHDEMLAIISCSEHHSSVGAEFKNMERVID